MSFAPSLIKQPAESRLYTMDFSALLASDETISSVTSVTDDSSDDLTLGSPTYSNTTASVRISGGTSGKTWKVTFVVATSAGNTLEGEGLLSVRDL